MYSSYFSVLSPRRIAMGFCLLIVLIGLIGLLKACLQPKPAPATSPVDSVWYWRNQYNQVITSQRDPVGDFGIPSKGLLDTLSKEHNTKPSRIEGYVLATVKGKTSLVPVPESGWVGLGGDTTAIYSGSGFEIDTLHFPRPWSHSPFRMRQDFQSPWYHARVQLGDSAYLQLESRDTVTAVWKIVKEGPLFHRNRYLQLDLRFADTTRQITGIRAFKKALDTKYTALTAHGSLFYTGTGITPFLSLGLRRQANRLNTGIYVGKNPFRPDVLVEASASFDLIRL